MKAIVSTGLLALGVCIVLLLLIRYICSEEGFADKPVAIYDFGKFFAPFQLEAICPVWDTVYTNFKGGYKTDDKGHQLPEDVVKKVTDTAIAKVLPKGVFPCPFAFPKGKDLDTVLTWLTKQDKNLLLQAHTTLVFCKTQLESTLNTAHTSIDDMKNGRSSDGFIDMFLTQCSAEELLARAAVPLQCVDPTIELGTEANQIKAQDPAATTEAVKKKIEITKLLTAMWSAYATAVPPVQRIDFAETIQHCKDILAELSSIKKKLESGETSF
jgi:hypothetical protein